MARQSVHQQIQTLSAKAKSLSEFEQAVWHKTRLGGYRPAEIAACLHLPLHTVYELLDSAQVKLAKQQETDS